MASGIGSTAMAQSPVADDFNGTSLNTSLWTVVAPVGGSATVSNGHLLITVPGGSNHDAFNPALDAVQVVQQVSNANFDVNVKIDSTLAASGQYSGQGILVEGDAHDYIRLEISANGSRVALSANTIIAGTQAQKFLIAPFSPYVVPTYLRLNRTGSTYTAYYSADGTNWTQAGSFADSSLTVTGLALYGSNFQSNPANAPAITPSFDWFHNTTTTSVATPTFNPASGTSFTSSLSVSINESTTGSTVYYTTDNSTPTTSSKVYSSPITIVASTTFKAIAVASGVSSAVGTANYTLTQSAGPPVADDFNGSSLNTGLWTVQAPVGGSAAVSNGHLVINVPGGSNHDGFTPALDAVQVVQQISNANFDVNVKIDSTLAASGQYSGDGILVEGDAHNYIRFGVGANGSAVDLSANVISGGTQSTAFQVSPFSAYTVPTYLRLNRTGSTYTGYYSADGANWIQAGSFTDGSLTVTGLAPYGWNYNATPSNAVAVAASFDWFHNTTTTGTVATPSISPASGTTFSSTLSVSISDSTANSTIHYTTDGSTPTSSSTVYGGAFTISASTTVKAIATASGLNQSGVATASYTLMSGSTGGVVSDNLDEPALNTSLWTIENPAGDGTVVMTGSGVNLNVPMGKNHDLTTAGNNAVRIMQPVSNSDFSVDVRFQSAVEIGNQDEGILVEQDSGDFLRFDVVFNGAAGPSLFAAGITGTTETTFVNTPISLAQGPLWLRLSRSGNVWTGSWSTNGTNFSAAPNFTFNLNAVRIGPYGGNSNATVSNTPAFTAVVDYFFATSGPIANQDGPRPYGYVTVDANPASTMVEKTLADIQGTGHLEPVIGLESESQANNNGASGVYWYQYPASGKLSDPWIRHTIIGSGYAYEDMLAVDVNGDGAVDIVCSFGPNGSNPEIVWFQNPRGQGGNPITDTWTMHVIGPGVGENSLLVADIDGDGKLDVISSSYVFFQNSPTSWTAKQYSTSFRGVALLDIGSGNGAVNLAGTQPGSPFNISWWENPRETGGDARTGTWILHIIGPGYPCSANNCDAGTGGGEVAAYNSLDVNGDGRMDVVSGQSEGPGGGIAPPPGGVIWWEAPADRRNGAWIKHTMDFNMVDVHKIQVADMDRNGTLDIVVAEQDQSALNRVAVFYNDGKGNLTEQTISNGKGHNDAVGDVTGTGPLDILSSGHGYFNDPHPLQIFLNPY